MFLAVFSDFCTFMICCPSVCIQADYKPCFEPYWVVFVGFRPCRLNAEFLLKCLQFGIDVACIGIEFLPTSGRRGNVWILLKRFKKDTQKTLKIFGIVIYSLYLCIRNQSGNRLMKSLKIPCGLTSLARILKWYRQQANF